MFVISAKGHLMFQFAPLDLLQVKLEGLVAARGGAFELISYTKYLTSVKFEMCFTLAVTQKVLRADLIAYAEKVASAWKAQRGRVSITVTMTQFYTITRNFTHPSDIWAGTSALPRLALKQAIVKKLSCYTY